MEIRVRPGAQWGNGSAAGSHDPVCGQTRAIPISGSTHWESVYEAKSHEEVSWFEPLPQTSLSWIERAVTSESSVVDIGGGASRLAGELVKRGFRDVTVADISGAALRRARAELGEAAQSIKWVIGDVRDFDFGRQFDLWHDRAVFHFMVTPEDRQGYLATLERALAPEGQAVVATFGPDGPTHCSGLPTARYGPKGLEAVLPDSLALVSSEIADHVTPGGGHQQFQYALIRRDVQGRELGRS